MNPPKLTQAITRTAQIKQSIESRIKIRRRRRRLRREREKSFGLPSLHQRPAKRDVAMRPGSCARRNVKRHCAARDSTTRNFARSESASRRQCSARPRRRPCTGGSGNRMFCLCDGCSAGRIRRKERSVHRRASCPYCAKSGRRIHWPGRSVLIHLGASGEQIMAEAGFQKVGHFKDVAAFQAHVASMGLSLPMDDAILSAQQDSTLAQPIDVDGFTVGNRWCVHPMEGWDGTTTGEPTEHTIRRWQHFGAKRLQADLGRRSLRRAKRWPGEPQSTRHRQ